MTLAVEAVSKYYAAVGGRIEVLREVSFRLEDGQSLAVVGPSGTGKSTLLHILGGLDAPTSGRVLLEGEDPFSLSEAALARFRNKKVGFVFQDHHLLPQYDVLENTLLPTLAAAGGTADEERARSLLTSVGLAQRLSHRPAALSGGERQRVALARALINQPQLLLCDEPTGNLDAATAATVADLLFHLHKERAGILVIVTHAPSLAARCDHQLELRDGVGSGF